MDWDGTRIVIRLSLSHAFFVNRAVMEDLLKSRCRFTPFSILLDGTSYRADPSHRGVLGEVTIEHPDTNGWAGFYPYLDVEPGLYVFFGGVVAELLSIESRSTRFLAVVESDGFHRDLSHNRLVRNSMLEGVIDDLGRWEKKAFVSLARDLAADRINDHRHVSFSRELLMRRVFELGSLEEIKKAVEGEPLSDAPLWPMLDESWVSLDRIVKTSVILSAGDMETDESRDFLARVLRVRLRCRNDELLASVPL